MFRAFPVNATTMGTVTHFFHYFSNAQINPHDSMADNLQVHLPDAMEKCFQEVLKISIWQMNRGLMCEMIHLSLISAMEPTSRVFFEW